MDLLKFALRPQRHLDGDDGDMDAMPGMPGADGKLPDGVYHSIHVSLRFLFVSMYSE
jgi:hypothetical protein